MQLRLILELLYFDFLYVSLISFYGDGDSFYTAEYDTLIMKHTVNITQVQSGISILIFCLTSDLQ